jgi:cytochrome P450
MMSMMSMKESRLPPGPKALPVIGNLPGLMRDPLQYLTHLAHTYGDVVAFRFGIQPAVLVSDPALIDKLLRDRSLEHGEDTRRLMNSVFGVGLVSLEGTSHLQRRRVMAPAFHRERIQGYAATMIAEVYRMIEAWKCGEARDLYEQMGELTFSIVAQTLFNPRDPSEARRVAAGLARVHPWLLHTSMLTRVLPFRVPLVYGSAAHAARELQAVVRSIVAARREQPDDFGDLLSMLLAVRDEDGAALGDEEISADMLTVLQAGHDTIAHALTWCLYLLTQHPKVLEAVRFELDTVVGQRRVQFEDLAGLALLDRVWRETLRLYPPTWIAERVSAEPTELGGYRLPAKTAILYSVWVIHRHPRLFDAPERFDPDRFLPERLTPAQQAALLPFGGGVRKCIGHQFAMIEARIILAALVQSFDLQVAPRHPVRPRALIHLGMKSPLPLIPRRRDRVAAWRADHAGSRSV